VQAASGKRKRDGETLELHTKVEDTVIIDSQVSLLQIDYVVPKKTSCAKMMNKENGKKNPFIFDGPLAERMSCA
jgi:hypothetical protein